MKTYIKTIIFVFLISFFLGGLVATASARSLTYGTTGSDVVALQDKLISHGFLAQGKNTGYFGSLTLSAVKKFQCANNIACENPSAGYGVYGPKTQTAMASVTDYPKNPATVTESITAPAWGPFEVSGWVPDWRAASGTADVLPHLGQMTSVMPFGYKVSSEGKLIDNAKITEEPWKSFIAEAKRQKVRVIPTVVWGDGVAMQKILSNTTSRIALEDEIANLVKEKGFDGIDIDFEAKQRETINYFSTFLRGLYQRMGNKWVYCTVEARMPLENRYLPGTKIPDDATDYANDYIEMNKYCDRVEIMAYDQGTIDLRFNAARKAPYAPVADPGWVENLVRLAAQTISRNKLIIGIPTYGYEYLVTPLSGSGNYQYKKLWAFNPKYATDIATKLGTVPYRTSAGELGVIYDPNVLKEIAPSGDDQAPDMGNTSPTTVAQNTGSVVNTSLPFNYLTWSDSQAIKDKVDLARTLGVRGVAVFSLGGAEDQAMWDILK